MTAEKLDTYNNQLESLLKKYDISGEKNDVPFVDLSFKSTWKTWGSVTHQGGQYHKKLMAINFGSGTDAVATRTARKKFNGIIEYFKKSQVDEKNNVISTLTHEFAHVLSRMVSATNRVASAKEIAFWKEMRKIKSAYQKEIKSYKAKNDYYNFNETYLGNYASTNMNEFFAEAFTEFELNSNPSKYAKLVGELAEKYFKK